MTMLRGTVVLLLSASAGLPYAAPAACAAFRTEMTDPHMAAMHEGAQLTAEGGATSRCDFAECAIAPVAPVAAFAVSSAVVAVTDIALPLPAAGSDVDPTPPLTPPPQV